MHVCVYVCRQTNQNTGINIIYIKMLMIQHPVVKRKSAYQFLPKYLAFSIVAFSMEKTQHILPYIWFIFM